MYHVVLLDINIYIDIDIYFDLTNLPKIGNLYLPTYLRRNVDESFNIEWKQIVSNGVHLLRFGVNYGAFNKVIHFLYYAWERSSGVAKTLLYSTKILQRYIRKSIDIFFALCMSVPITYIGIIYNVNKLL